MNRTPRWISAATLCTSIACSAGPAESVVPPSSPEPQAAAPDAFVGTWRSVTPSLEFIGLFVTSKSSEMGVLGARLTFSGVAWEGSGRIEGDSLVANLTIPGTATARSVIVVHARDAQSLRATFRPEAAALTDLTFARER
jgi:hypothetical protein